MSDGFFAFPGFDLPQVELQLLVFKHIVSCVTLAWSSGDTDKELAPLEVLPKKAAGLGIHFPSIVFPLNCLSPFFV